ncbi:MAG: MBL fold metallo-hydrolase, partial [Gammaproteobacteria bacterium]|nr:MBL fold metallo-hydrolase [Gammaproteobacteria bacterium]
GQGDAVLIETPDGIIIVDGGPDDSLYHFMKYRYKSILDNNGKITIKAMVISHPDYDHYNGLKKIVVDKGFVIKNIYHNGISRYAKINKESIEDCIERMLEKGYMKSEDGQYVLMNCFNSLDDIKAQLDEGIIASGFKSFWKAVEEAGVEKVQVITVEDGFLPDFTEMGSNKTRIKVLGPVPKRLSGDKPEYLAFDEPPLREEEGHSENGYSHSHTRNGHSIVLRLEFGDHSFLFGGDLNIPAENHLMKHYGDENPFQVDVAKSCHHGSSDFTCKFLEKVNPLATVVSSGDNKSFDHPMADAMGAAGKYSRGDLPLVFSTELARAHQKGGKIHYGLINARSNGKVLAMAQMKEQHSGKSDIWDSYTVPWEGKFDKSS